MPSRPDPPLVPPRVALFWRQGLAEGLFELAFGVADVGRGDAGGPLGNEPTEPAWSGERIVQLGVDQVLDRFAQRFGLVSHHLTNPRAIAALLNGPHTPRRRGCETLHKWDGPASL